MTERQLLHYATPTMVPFDHLTILPEVGQYIQAVSSPRYVIKPVLAQICPPNATAGYDTVTGNDDSCLTQCILPPIQPLDIHRVIS